MPTSIYVYPDISSAHTNRILNVGMAVSSMEAAGEFRLMIGRSSSNDVERLNFDLTG